MNLKFIIKTDTLKLSIAVLLCYHPYIASAQLESVFKWGPLLQVIFFSQQ